ncbi:MAG TPA: hypothetical protein VGD42_17875 [Lysobacter sp.]
MMKITLGVFLACSVAAPVAAQVKADPAPQRFDAADSNHDGKVDRGEYDGFVEELVLLHDNDGDRKLSRAELSSARDLSRFDVIDADKDGFLTSAELAAFGDNDFAVMDGNKDGAIDRSEAEQHK